MAVVIIEGVDRVGKSTQVKKIEEYYRNKGLVTHVIHYSNPTGIPKEAVEEFSHRQYNEIFRFINWGLTETNSVYIFDRCHLSEMVYAPMYRKYDGEYAVKADVAFSGLLPIKLMLFTDNVENILKREDGASFSSVVEEKQKEIDTFDKAFEMSSILSKKRIDIRNKSEDEVFEKEVKPFLW